MTKPRKLELDKSDKELFERMKKEAVSENERRFFKEMEYRQQYHLTARDWLLFPNKTEAKIGFYRFDAGWYMLVIGEWGSKNSFLAEYTSLSDFLFDNWNQYKEINSQFNNMIEYLRSIDYAGIDYQADQDWD